MIFEKFFNRPRNATVNVMNFAARLNDTPLAIARNNKMTRGLCILRTYPTFILQLNVFFGHYILLNGT